MTDSGTRRPISSEPQKLSRSAKAQRRKAERAEKAEKAEEADSKEKAEKAEAHVATVADEPGISPARHLLERMKSARVPRPVLPRISLPGAGPEEIDLRDPQVHPRIAGRRNEVLSDERVRRRRYRIAGLCIAVALSAGVAVLFSPLFDMDHLLIEGVEGSPQREVSEATGLGGGTALFAIDASDVRSRIEELPWVAHASVSVRWPDRVELLVTPQQPVANVASGEGEAGAIATATGKVMAYEDVTPLVPFTGGLPVIRLPDADSDPEQVAGAIVAIDLLGPSTTASMGELSMDDTGALTLIVASGPARGAEVRMGSAEDLPEKAQAIEAVLSGVVETRCLATLDVSVSSRITIQRVPECDLPAPQQPEDR